VRDRFHDLPHGGYFERTFVERYWKPYIHFAKIVPSEWDVNRPSAAWWMSLLSSRPVAYILRVVLMALILLLAWRLMRLWL
jgi:hypothetical protein